MSASIGCCIMSYHVVSNIPILTGFARKPRIVSNSFTFLIQGEIDRVVLFQGRLGSGPGGPRCTEVSLIGKSKKTGDLAEDRQGITV